MAAMQKAIIYKGPGHFAYEDRPIPEIQDKNDVKIRSYGCAICGSDLNIFAVPQRHPVSRTSFSATSSAVKWWKLGRGSPI